MEVKADFDVLIVGYSMLGNVAALLLAHYGFKVVVVEKKPLSDILVSKSARIDDEVMMIFEQLGLSKAIESLLYPLEGSQIVDKKGRVLLEFNHEGHSQFAPLYGFYQPALQAILQKKAFAHPNISIYQEFEVETFEQNDEKVEVYITPTGQQEFTQLNCSYMLVCNGQHSRIADYLDIEIEHFNYQSSVLCVDTQFKENSSLHPFAQTIYDAEFPVVRITNNAKHQRWEFQIGNEDFDEAGTSEKVKTLLSELSTVPMDIDAAFVYQFEARILEEWRRNRVLIVGDAAHIIPPFLGMGLAAGIKDLYNLVWKLKIVQEKVVNATVLDSYQLEREADVRHIIQLNLWIKRLFNSSKMRWIKSFVPIIPKWFLKKKLDTSNQVKKGIIGNKTKGAGTAMFSAKVITHKAETMSLNAALGMAFVLIGLGKNPVDAVDAEWIEYLAHLQVQFVHLTLSSDRFLEDTRYAQNLFDKEGKIEAWMNKNKANFVLIRPDRMVYEFCNDAKALNHAIRGLAQKMPLFVDEEEWV